MMDEFNDKFQTSLFDFVLFFVPIGFRQIELQLSLKQTHPRETSRDPKNNGFNASSHDLKKEIRGQ